jgi:hypothetical protein
MTVPLCRSIATDQTLLKRVELPLLQIERSLDRFVNWLEQYGETSWDHQSYFGGAFGGRAKALYYRKPSFGTLAVAPMILSEAFAPSARRFFAPRWRLPIADAHYAMGFAFLAQVRGDSRLISRAVHFLNELEKSRCSGYTYMCWGYPFDWVTRTGTIPKGTPLITSTPYVYEGFREVYGLDRDPRWRQALVSIAQHTAEDIKDQALSESAASCSYTSFGEFGVINANAYRGFLLTCAAVDLDDERYSKIAERNINFVLENQRPDGSWYYAIDSRAFVDHFHTCFVLKALAKIDRLKPSALCRDAIRSGVDYYLKNLLDENGLPKPFAKAPRMTVYRRELYDYAECVNLCILLRDRFPALQSVLERVVRDLLSRWIKKDGSFRSRELWLGWDNVPMHRWAQSQIFRSLSLLALRESQAA